ncbi:hypothetical protein EJB05_31639 [Eragrostis curvula]|uniref:Replication protein A 70 kDa DNA-binding subunit B/D first OB fold domain-containing protein n=1 Tax=Eragrostis curvula TaxID=38414 RepID=A0A5J9UF69_9POAL|nr:hypothetical protein EJB05_31639 [Eragrostis curvula]
MFSSQDGFTPLSRLALGNQRWRSVRVRISRMWVASNPLTGTKFGLDCLLIDDEGGTMQARAYRWDMERLQQQLVEGKIYALSDFTVRPRLDKYMACSNSLMIVMGEWTVVEEMDEDAYSPIPLHSFEFVDFDDVPCWNGDRSLFIDVIGQIKSIEDIGRTWKWETWSNIPFRNIRLIDLRGEHELNVALFGDLVKGFTAYSTSASKCYLNLEIPEVQKFRASLHGPPISIGRHSCEVQKPINPNELVDSWRTIQQLKNLSAHELQKHIFLCRATLKGIECSKGWWYRSCYCCQKSIRGCICPNNRSSVRWLARYKLNAVMKDDTGTMNVIIFDEPAKELVGGAEAEELIEEVTAEKISAAVRTHRSRVFAVAFENGCFMVKRIFNDDMEQRLGSEMAAADDIDLALQEQGPSASSSYSGSPEVEEENIEMMGLVRKLKRLKTTDEPEQPDETKEEKKVKRLKKSNDAQ